MDAKWKKNWENFVTVSNLPGRHEAPPGPSTVPTQAHWWSTRENWSFPLSFWRCERATLNDRLWNVSRYCQASPICQSHVTFSLFPENNLIVSRESIEYIDVTGRPRGFLSRSEDRAEERGYMNARIANYWISWISWTRKLVASFKRTGSECYTGAIMTVPPELPPGTLRCSVFLVGIDRGEAAIPFSSDVVCDPRIHVSESDDEPRTFLVIPTRGQHCARYSLFT